MCSEHRSRVTTDGVAIELLLCLMSFVANAAGLGQRLEGSFRGFRILSFELFQKNIAALMQRS